MIHKVETWIVEIRRGCKYPISIRPDEFASPIYMNIDTAKQLRYKLDAVIAKAEMEASHG